MKTINLQITKGKAGIWRRLLVPPNCCLLQFKWQWKQFWLLWLAKAAIPAINWGHSATETQKDIFVQQNTESSLYNNPPSLPISLPHVRERMTKMKTSRLLRQPVLNRTRLQRKGNKSREGNPTLPLS